MVTVVHSTILQVREGEISKIKMSIIKGSEECHWMEGKLNIDHVGLKAWELDHQVLLPSWVMLCGLLERVVDVQKRMLDFNWHEKRI